MAQVCDALPYLKGLLAEGYSPVVKRNGRRVGAYHAAVSAALREWFDATPGGLRLNAAKIRLTDGVRPLPAGLTAERTGSAVSISWRDGIGWRGAKLLFAAKFIGAKEWVSAPVALANGAVGANIALPAHWASGRVEIWVAFVGDGGRVRSQTLYRALAPAAALPSPSPAKRGLYTSASMARLARKGPRASRTHRVSTKKTPNACRFGLPGHFCVVKRKR